MSQSVGVNYKSRIPSFSDDASIVEALRVYHYGVDDYTTQPIPNDSIEGNFRTLNDSIGLVSASVTSLLPTYLVRQPSLSNRNIIVSASADTTNIPLLIRAIPSQTAQLIQFENSSSVSVGSISTGGFVNFAGYISVGSTNQTTTSGINVTLSSASHRGITVRGQSSQSANLQEWQNSSASAIAWVDADGKVFSNSLEVVNLSDTQTLTNKTLQSPQFTGIPNAPTATNTTNNQQVATTEFVKTAIGTLEINSRSSNYTAALSDIGKLIIFTGGSTLTIPVESSVAFPTGSSFSVMQSTSTTLSISPASGVTINSTPGNRLRTQFSVATLTKTGSNTWLLFGDLMI